MCLILFSYNNHPQFKLILASNRDEFYNRPTTPLHLWDDTGLNPILAGRDQQEKGTWLGVTPSGRFSGITNYRSMAHTRSNAPSRGLLVSNYLKESTSPKNYLEEIRKDGYRYSGFNLITGDADGMFYYSNISNDIQEIKPGIYGLSNAFLNTPWPKIKKGKAAMDKILSSGSDFQESEFFALLADSDFPPEDELPDTGVGIEWERILSPLFIKSDVYGTRTSTIITIDYNGTIKMVERTFEKTATGIDRKGTVSEILSQKKL